MVIILGSILVLESSSKGVTVFTTSQKSSQPLKVILNPTTSIIKPSTQSIQSKSFNAVPSLEKLDFNNKNSFLHFANAISPSESTITIQSWSGSLGLEAAFDSSWDEFSANWNAGTQIAFINIATNTKETWVLPNNEGVSGDNVNGLRKMAVDSAGNLYFEYNPDEQLVQLNPATNVFTEYNTGRTLMIRIMIDSLNNVFFDSNTNGIGQAIRKLDPSTNTETIWQLPFAINNWDMDSSGNIYLTGDGIIGELNTNTNALTTWSDTVEDSYVTFDSSGNIFISSPGNPYLELGRLSTSDNTLTEWIIPTSSEGEDISDIATDSAGSVFFTEGGNLIRFVPSTEVFTFFSTGCSTLKIASDDTIYCHTGSGFSKIT
jgi:streptogramin lyase